MIGHNKDERAPVRIRQIAYSIAEVPDWHSVSFEMGVKFPIIHYSTILYLDLRAGRRNSQIFCQYPAKIEDSTMVRQENGRGVLRTCQRQGLVVSPARLKPRVRTH